MSDRREGEGRLLERRDLLVAATALVGGGLAASAGSSAASGEGGVAYVAAKVVGRRSANELEVEPAGSGITVRMRLASGASVVRRGDRARLSDFAVGDTVTLDVPGRSDWHMQLTERDRGRVFTAVAVADMRAGTVASRGRSVG